METDPLPTAETPKTKLRWYQYSLRSLFVLTTLVAIGMSWVATKIQQKRAERLALSQIEKLGGLVHVIGPEGEGDTSIIVYVWKKPAEPRWLRRVIGEDIWDNGYDIWLPAEDICGIGGYECTDHDLARIPWSDFRRLRAVYIFSRKVTDEGLSKLETLRSIEALLIVETKITDGGIERFKRVFPQCFISRKADAPEGLRDGDRP
jgi:hypothetical protein